MTTMSNTIVARLASAVASGDLYRMGQCLTSFIGRTISYASLAEREEAVEGIMSALQAFPENATIVAGCIGAIAFATLHCVECSFPVVLLLNAVKPHEKDLLTVQAASRLFSYHVCSTKKLIGLPLLSEAAARWIEGYPNDGTVNYYAPLVLIVANEIHPIEIKKAHGEIGVETIGVATVKAATATRLVEVQVDGVDWNAYILSHLFPRIRVR